MLGHQDSYWKTLLLAGMSGVAAIIGVYFLPIALDIVKTEGASK